ncbi:hypothetical protein B0H34DRAFT_433133 [Crassisporium funariophilum]|nr:hypothetical protein B0H34DRAFT_433133 [Crassisporium funariophilum]
MFHCSAWLLLLSLSSASASALIPGKSYFERVGKTTTRLEGECATPYSKRDELEMKKAFAEVRVRRQTDPVNVVFDTYVNVVAANMTLEGGWIPDSQIVAQMDHLNKGYQGTGISFRFINTTRIISSYWHQTLYTPESDLEITILLEFGSTFKKGGVKDLNLNFIGFTLNDDTAGFGFPPSLIEDVGPADGVYVKYTTVPGGSDPDRQGSTATHEVGHWLSLWHTFQGGCDGEIDGEKGDGVEDTAPQATSSLGECPIGRDSCPGGGPDPINNIMDYGKEECRTSFTPGQITRMHEAILAYRH